MISGLVYAWLFREYDPDRPLGMYGMINLLLTKIEFFRSKLKSYILASAGVIAVIYIALLEWEVTKLYIDITIIYIGFGVPMCILLGKK